MHLTITDVHQMNNSCAVHYHSNILGTNRLAAHTHVCCALIHTLKPIIYSLFIHYLKSFLWITAFWRLITLSYVIFNIFPTWNMLISVPTYQLHACVMNMVVRQKVVWSQMLECNDQSKFSHRNSAFSTYVNLHCYLCH